MSEDLFRYCVHCGADCDVAEPEHVDSCPFVTGIWPVREEDADHCPHCGKDTGEMICMDCGAPLDVGDHYALRDVETGALEVRPEIGDVICLGCAASLGLVLGEIN